jgi:phospholipase A1
MPSFNSKSLALTALLLVFGSASAQGRLPAPEDNTALQMCAATQDNAARLACYDQWAGQAPALAAPTLAAPPTNQQSAEADNISTSTEMARTDACHDKRYSTLSRFWELENDTDCGTFRIRGYRPLSFSVIGSNSVNEQPSSSAANHTAATPINYNNTETRLQLSMRTKVAQGLFTQSESGRKDSLWFAYSQQSYWQLFSSNISRPFRTTDHEPELVYIYPTDAKLPFNWRLRYSGVGLVHQSNGQSLPLSRSWNRVYLSAGAELDNRWLAQARVWQRLSENAALDDNPGIEDTIGRGELKTLWNVDQQNSLGLTWLHSLRRDGNGSARLEWLRTIGSRDDGGRSNLRLHTQLFSGYGDSLIDYNRKRTVFSVGLSLLDF